MPRHTATAGLRHDKLSIRTELFMANLFDYNRRQQKSKSEPAVNENKPIVQRAESRILTTLSGSACKNLNYKTENNPGTGKSVPDLVASLNDDMAVQTNRFSRQSSNLGFNNNLTPKVSSLNKATIKNLGDGDPISDLFKRAINYGVSSAKQVAYDATIRLTRSAIEYADKNYNPFTIYENITNPHSALPKWQAESLAKYSNVAVSSDVFIASISGLSKIEVKRQKSGRGNYNSQSGGPKSRYVFDPANSERVIDMRHFLSIGEMGEVIGLGVEVVQSTKDSWRHSAFDLQDFYSNELGRQFYNSNFYQEYKSGDIDFSQALKKFFEKRYSQQL